MTVYSGAIGRKAMVASSKIEEKISPSKVNLILLVLSVAMLLSYVLLANFITSQRYLLNLRQNQFNQISVQLNGVASAGGDDYNLEDLLTFAKSAGMIEAKDITTILYDSEFALMDVNR